MTAFYDRATYFIASIDSSVYFYTKNYGFNGKIIKSRLKWQFVVGTMLIVILCNELFMHRMQPWQWWPIDCEGGDDTCTKILLIADPQLQGEMAVSPPLSYLFNWDSDQYVQQTFRAAINYFDPDILIFLGDLTDEGSISNKQQFHRYIKRLMHIFNTDKPVMQVWIPGDNDIGGENERISMDKVREFDLTFEQPDVLKLGNNIVVYKLNRITHKMPRMPSDHVPSEDSFNIVVSHYPILGKGIFSKQAIQTLRPDLIFCGHDHLAKYVESPKGSPYGSSLSTPMSPGDNLLQINFKNDTLYEIYVPTCSYRMGVPNMGYGAAVLEHNNKQLRYQVLWSRRRFPVLFFYVAVLLLTGFIVIYLITCRRVRMLKRRF